MSLVSSSGFNVLFKFTRSRRLRFLLGSVGLYWLLNVFYRVLFLIFFFQEATAVKNADIWRALWLSVRFDLRLAIICTLPLIVFMFLPRINVTSRPGTRRVARVYWGVSVLLLNLFYAFDLGHYAYLKQRLDIVALNLLEDPSIAFQMLWESYPLVWIVLGLGGIVFLLDRVFVWLLQTTVSKPPVAISRKQKVVGVGLTSLLLLIGYWGTLAQYRLLWSDTTFSSNPFVSSLALNPVLYFYTTLQFQEQDYDEGAVRRDYDLLADWLGVEARDSLKLNFAREVNPPPLAGEQPLPNIVIILLESVGANRLGTLGNPLQATPNLDRLIDQGLFFERCYVPYVGTARSVFALLTGIPDVAQVRTSSRNPLIREQYIPLSGLENYQLYFLLGGSASWANIRTLITYNLPGLTLLEMDDFDRPRLDVWGISDLDLFREAHELFRSRPVEQPFLAIIQTATNHKPYSIPEDNAGFKVRSVPEDSLRRAGFQSLDQYNAMRFLDHSLGEFFRLARSASYFQRTLFVLVADHGRADPKAYHMPPADFDLKLRSYHVPFIIYAPAYLPEPRTVSTVCSLTDVLPTVLSLVGLPYRAQTMGRDVLHLQSREALALIINKKLSPPSYGVVGRDFYLQVFLDGSGDSLHRLDSATPLVDVRDQYPDVYLTYQRYATALYEGARYMLYHNKH